MRYLFGDSTPFPLSFNFLDTLEAATEACVALLHLDDDAATRQRMSRRRRARTEDELARLDLLRDRIEAELAPHLGGDAHDAVSDAAARLANDLDRAVAAAREAVARRGGPARVVEDPAPLRVLERLLVAHELPHTEWWLHWETACGDEPAHAVAIGRAGLLEAELGIRIPDDHALAEPVRFGELTDDTGAPVDGARLGDYFVTRAEHGPDGCALRVQETPRRAARGFDVVVPAERASAPVVSRVGESAQLLIAPDRAPDFAAASARLEQMLRSALPHRDTLFGATLDGVQVAKLERPRQLVEALIAAVGPLARELCERSKVPGEITLKVETGDPGAGGHREELFIPQAALLARLRGLSAEQRALFGALGLEGASDIVTAQVRRLDLPLRASPNSDV